MRANRLCFFKALVVVCCFGAGSNAQSIDLSATTTLLPQESGAAAEPGGFLVQSGAASGQLQFDLSGLPLDLKQFDRCTLRLVVKKNEASGHVIVKGRLPGATTGSIVNLGVAEDGRPILGASKAAGEFCKAIFTQYGNKDSKGKVFSIVLFTDSSKARTRIDSLKSVGAEFSSLPRLVIEYTATPPSLLQAASWPQHQHDPEHTGRSSWAPTVPPSGFTVAEVKLPFIPAGGSLVDYPLIYKGNLYIIYKSGTENRLVCLDFSGKNKLWETSIGTGTVQRSPAIGPSGLLYAVTEEKIAAYDLNQDGREAATYSLGSNKSTQYTDLTVGNDGSVFLALQEPSGVNYILGFTANLAPFIRRGPFDRRTSSITASESGDQIFAEAPQGAVVVDIANPVSLLPQELKGAAEYYHTPVAGPARAISFSAFKDTGSVWGFTVDASGKLSEAWPASTGSLTPQPALGSNGCVYLIQDGKLKARGCGSGFDKGNDLKTSSNLVLDGADNIYFWSNGELRAFKADGEPLFAPQAIKLDQPSGLGPEKFLRLMMAPDGTLWANNKGAQSLYAFKPKYTDPNPTVSGTVTTRTVYRATDKLAVAGNVTVPAGTAESPTQVIFEAQNGISFSPGFKVEKGASLLCRTGF